MDIYFSDVFKKLIFDVFIEITLLCLGFTCMLDKRFNTDHYEIKCVLVWDGSSLVSYIDTVSTLCKRVDFHSL